MASYEGAERGCVFLHDPSESVRAFCVKSPPTAEQDDLSGLSVRNITERLRALKCVLKLTRPLDGAPPCVRIC